MQHEKKRKMDDGRWRRVPAKWEMQNHWLYSNCMAIKKMTEQKKQTKRNRNKWMKQRPKYTVNTNLQKKICSSFSIENSKANRTTYECWMLNVTESCLKRQETHRTLCINEIKNFHRNSFSLCKYISGNECG